MEDRVRTSELWKDFSTWELEYLADADPREEVQAEMSWCIEGAIVLAWCVGLLDDLPPLDADGADVMETFRQRVPAVGGCPPSFLNTLRLRDKGEIYEENLLNEKATAYFRDLLFNGRSDETDIDRGVSLERHRALNWVRNVGGNGMDVKWEETDTST